MRRRSMFPSILSYDSLRTLCASQGNALPLAIPQCDSAKALAAPSHRLRRHYFIVCATRA